MSSMELTVLIFLVVGFGTGLGLVIGGWFGIWVWYRWGEPWMIRREERKRWGVFE